MANAIPPGADVDAQKRAAAEAAVAEVEAGMLVGLGTGSTAAFAIAALGGRVAAGLRVRAAATSEHTAASARAAGIEVVDMGGLARLDLCIDGVDEIDARLVAIKGAGGAMLREKVVAQASARMLAIADASKRVERLGGRPVPVELIPFARGLVEERVAALGGRPVRRERDGAPFVTDGGHHVLDCRFDKVDDPAALAAALSAIPGCLGHGLFVTEVSRLYLAGPDGVAVIEREP